MSFSRSLCATLLSAATSFSIVTASGCGTKAVGVDACRDIETARCRAGSHCDGYIDDVAACERYSRDHCLHGLSASPPPEASVGACVKAIEAAGECAMTGADTPLGECETEVPATRPGLATACDVVRHPERASECEFLTDLPPDDGSGGQPATGGSSSDEDEDAVAGQGGTRPE